MDLRILIVLFPLILAGGWAVSRILPYALQQAKAFLAK
jgi:photosystem II PsbY protein